MNFWSSINVSYPLLVSKATQSCFMVKYFLYSGEPSRSPLHCRNRPCCSLKSGECFPDLFTGPTCGLLDLSIMLISLAAKIQHKCGLAAEISLQKNSEKRPSADKGFKIKVTHPLTFTITNLVQWVSVLLQLCNQPCHLLLMWQTGMLQWLVQNVKTIPAFTETHIHTTFSLPSNSRGWMEKVRVQLMFVMLFQNHH